MITPRYMICSETRVVDRYTGAVSHINLIDKLVTTRPGASQAAAPALRMFISAAWAADEAILGQSCEWQTLVSFPGDTEPRLLAEGEFQFSSPPHPLGERRLP